MQLYRSSNYLQGYSAPIGFGMAAKHPDWRKALIIQSGNAYEERLKNVMEHEDADVPIDPARATTFSIGSFHALKAFSCS